MGSEFQIFHIDYVFYFLNLKPMKTLFIAVSLLFLAACAPVNQTVANVSNLVGGTQVVSYQADAGALATAIQDITTTMPLYNGYTPLRAEAQGIEKVVVSARALKGSVASDPNAEDFSLEFSLVDKGGYTELTVRPSSASNNTARQLVTDYVKLLDETFARYQ
jgi:hypothetical protein